MSTRTHAVGLNVMASESVADITGRPDGGTHLMGSGALNRSLMDAVPDCIKVLDIDGRLSHMNTPGLCAMEVDDLGAIRGQEWEALWPSEAREEIKRALTRAVGGEASSFQAYDPTAKGTPNWWEVTVSPIRDADNGRVTQFLSVFRDITERKQVQDRLGANEADFRAIFDQSSVAMAQMSATTGRLIRVNSEYCELIGYSTEEVAEMTPSDLSFGTDSNADLTALGPLFRGESPSYDQERRYRRKDGKIVWIHEHAKLMRDLDGRPRAHNVGSP